MYCAVPDSVIHVSNANIDNNQNYPKISEITSAYWTVTYLDGAVIITSYSDYIVRKNR